ncbi:FAD-binding protein [Aminithiophilus ramosus]|uniref:FAD-binding protein n=2 Tax=Synergistales TaxID=649776 RepID=A0A9Q7EVI2_9BACT|nr:FAD-linked oxidase C-terminal domain-containing protein [Aminithiophilus ramosus]QTX32004.1 FAD-binding protein [Aminithiophilus ramosus]QVL35845.1 FAD-binding protein [Synergistota bacterium]
MTEYRPVTAHVVERLQNILGARNVSCDADKLLTYSRDEVQGPFWKDGCLAEVVVFPESTEDVAALVRLAGEERIPLTARGAGTGLSGGAVPARRGIVVSFEKMNRIIELDRENLTLTVEPGVVTAEINRAAVDAGLLYAGDPCSGDASFIGGNVAENAGGNKVVKYGPTGSHVLALEAVMADGSVTWFGGKRRKDVTGYDFVHLLVGSEGTLALITKIVLKLLPLPAEVVDLLVPFPDVASAVAFVPRIVTEGKVLPASIEFMDRRSINLTERFLNTNLPYSDAGAHLIIQLEGNDAESLADEYERIGDLCLAHGALEVFVADNRNSRDKLWKARKSITESVWAFHPGKNVNEDVVVPTGAVPELMRRLDEIVTRAGSAYVVFGHIGDGNMHVTAAPAPEEPDRESILHRIQDELYDVVKSLGGTLTGEHGVGLKRRDAITRFLDATQIDLIRRVKLAFDPQNILNPDKIVPWE